MFSTKSLRPSLPFFGSIFAEAISPEVNRNPPLLLPSIRLIPFRCSYLIRLKYAAPVASCGG
ncbi:hypothetical protein F2Q69_00020613 [Brassica cretica]|uniref:Uncharacterized protein n=1 Tax=Brassica cretica TaxID=69181 RepID=A0A8S9QIT2_BRACR|nr:hypothetical protein F2Q69_00020613 [Brassica cretica]